MIIKKVYKGLTPFVKGYKGTTVIFEEGGGYEPLEYIQSVQANGEYQWIDTGVQPTLQTSMKLGIEMLEQTGDTIVGNTLGGGSLDSHDWHLFNYSGSILWDCVENRLWTGSFPPNQYYDFECGNNYVIQDGTLYSGSTSTWTVSEMNILVFGQSCIFGNSNHRDYDRQMAFSVGKLYYLQIFENGVMIRDYVPARVNGEVGLYDRLNNQFYGNLGDGSFIAGEL